MFISTETHDLSSTSSQAVILLKILTMTSHIQAGFRNDGPPFVDSFDGADDENETPSPPMEGKECARKARPSECVVCGKPTTFCHFDVPSCLGFFYINKYIPNNKRGLLYEKPFHSMQVAVLSSAVLLSQTESTNVPRAEIALWIKVFRVHTIPN